MDIESGEGFNKQRSNDYLDMCISYRFNYSVKYELEKRATELQNTHFECEYPFTKREHWGLPDYPPTVLNHVTIFFFILLIFPLILMFMQFCICLAYYNYLKLKSSFRKMFLEYKYRYLNGER